MLKYYIIYRKLIPNSSLHLKIYSKQYFITTTYDVWKHSLSLKQCTRKNLNRLIRTKKKKEKKEKNGKSFQKLTKNNNL